MGDYLTYWKTVLRRAWNEACALMLPDSKKVAIRDGAILLVAIVCMFWLRTPLANHGLIERSDNPLIDQGIPVLFGLCAVVALFACYFVLEALFISPWRLWREKDATPARIEAAAARSLRLGPINYSIWDLIDPLELYQVACLWIDRAPPESSETELTGDAAASFHMLSQAMRNGELHPQLTDSERSLMAVRDGLSRFSPASKSPEPSKRIVFTRKELVRFARSKSAQPLFLFPKARQTSWMRV